MKKIIKELYPYLIILIVVILIKTFVIAPVQVNGDSMDKILQNGDVMLLNKIGYKLNGVARFDIVVINYDGNYLIKRVIGMPGDTIKVIDNKLYINNQYVEEEYLDSNVITNSFEIDEIPDDHYFVMGDNRDVSLDSRVLGTFSSKDIEGIAELTIFPFSRFGFK